VDAFVTRAPTLLRHSSGLVGRVDNDRLAAFLVVDSSTCNHYAKHENCKILATHTVHTATKSSTYEVTQRILLNKPAMALATTTILQQIGPLHNES
jgi:hypothetical protein